MTCMKFLSLTIWLVLDKNFGGLFQVFLGGFWLKSWAKLDDRQSAVIISATYSEKFHKDKKTQKHQHTSNKIRNIDLDSYSSMRSDCDSDSSHVGMDSHCIDYNRKNRFFAIIIDLFFANRKITQIIRFINLFEVLYVVLY